MSETNGAVVIPDLDTLRKKRDRIVQEAAMDFYGILNAGFDPYDMYQDLASWNQYPYVVPAWYRQSQKRGENIPIYLDENQLRFLRDRSRKLIAENPFCQCAIDNMKNYVVGEDGFILTAVSAQKHNPAPPKLLARVQRVIDLWSEHNDLPELEADIVERMMVDGDAFVRHFPQSQGVVSIRVVEPEHVKAPPGQAYGPQYSFGIQTDPDDIETRIGYWVVENPIASTLPVFVPADEITHFKMNTKRSAKRGLPTFYNTEVLLRDAVDLLRGTVVTANVRARYAVIRKMGDGVVREAAQKFLTELNTATVNDPATGQQINVEKVPFGSVKNIGHNQEIEFPAANMESDAFYKALQMVLRAIAARLNMPEWMLSADASNNNYSSGLVAEAPSTKMFARMQKILGRRFGEYRALTRRSLAWIQIVYAVAKGILPPETLKLVRIQAEGPSLVVRDISGEAQANAIMNQARIKSRTTWQMEQSLDPDKERSNFQKEDKEDQARALQVRSTEINANATLPNEVSNGQPAEPNARQELPVPEAEPAVRTEIQEATPLGPNDTLTSKLHEDKRRGEGWYRLHAWHNGDHLGEMSLNIYKDHEDKTVARTGDTYTDDIHQGKGLTHHMYNEAIKHAKALGAERIESDNVRKPQVSKIWQNLGASLTDEKDERNRRYTMLLSKPDELKEGLKEDLQGLHKRIHDPDAGFTYQPYSHKQPTKGYAVSPYLDRSVAMDHSKLSFKDLVGYARKNKDLLHKSDHYLGAWHDPKSDKVYLDISQVHDTPEAAAKTAKEHDQLAYFDLGKGQSVSVPGTKGGSL